MQKNGFTLLELLITMGFITLISVMVTTVYVTGIRTYQQELASSTVQSNGQTILDALTTDIKNGVSIDATYETYTTDGDTIIIRIPAVDTSKNVLYNGTSMRFDRVVYDYTDNQIHKIIYADPESTRYSHQGVDTIIDRDVLSLGFTYDPDQASATFVTATISSDIKIGNDTRTITLTGKARLRNHI